MLTEVVTITAESAPFWGPATFIFTIIAIALPVVGLLGSILARGEDEGGLFGGGLMFGAIALGIGFLISGAGVAVVLEDSKIEQLAEIGFDKVDLSDDEFTASKDGEYYEGILVFKEQDDLLHTFQVVEVPQ